MPTNVLSMKPWPQNPNPMWFLIAVTLMLIAVALSGCFKAPVDKLPPPPAEIIEAAVAVPVPCKIAEVAVPDYPANKARKGDDIYTLTKIAMADRKVRQGETEELRAANTGGCE